MVACIMSASGQSEENKQEYRVVENRHQRVETATDEEGNEVRQRVIYRRGDTFVPTNTELDRFGFKLEPTGGSAEPQVQREAEELQTAAQQTPGERQVSTKGSQNPDAQGHAAGTESFDAEGFVDRDADTVENQIAAGHADGHLQQVVHADGRIRNGRKGVAQAIEERAEEVGEQVVTDGDAGNDSSDSSDSNDSNGDEE